MHIKLVPDYSSTRDGALVQNFHAHSKACADQRAVPAVLLGKVAKNKANWRVLISGGPIDCVANKTWQ